MNNDITNYIKTECGLSEYYLLKARKGFFNKLRFYWFVAIATIRDLPKKKPEFRDNQYLQKKLFNYKTLPSADLDQIAGAI